MLPKILNQFLSCAWKATKKAIFEWLHTAFGGQRNPKQTDSCQANTKRRVVENKIDTGFFTALLNSLDQHTPNKDR
jgi:hypothetical protein